MPNDLLVLSNAPNDGNTFVEEVFRFGDINATSAMAGVAANSTVIAGPMHRAGRVVDFAIAVVEPALSASGFISGNVSANLFILNGSTTISAITTLPAILGPVANSAAVVPKATNAGGGTSAVPANVYFSAGDLLLMNKTGNSAGSAAAGNTSVKGFNGFVKVRYIAE